MRRKAAIEGAAGGANVGIRVRAKVVKNKCAPPYRQAEFDIMFNSGISALGCLLEAAEAVGVVERRGAWFFAGETRLGQGKDKSMAALAADAELKAGVEAATRAKLGGPAVGEAAVPGLAPPADAKAAGASADDEAEEGTA